MKKLLILLILLGIILLAGCWAPPIGWGMPHMSSWMWSPFGFIGGLIGLALYFLPTIIAVARKKSNLLLIVLLNVFLGWTVIGWVVALVLALV